MMLIMKPRILTVMSSLSLLTLLPAESRSSASYMISTLMSLGNIVSRIQNVENRKFTLRTRRWRSLLASRSLHSRKEIERSVAIYS